MFTSFLNPRTPQQTRKTKRKWESCESVNEEEKERQVIDNLQTPPKKRACKVELQQDNRTPFGKVSSWIKATARSTVNLFRSFTEKYNLWQGGADDDDSGDIAPPVYRPLNMKPSINNSKQSASSKLRKDQEGTPLSSPTYRRKSTEESSRQFGRRTSLTDWRTTIPEDNLVRRPLHEPSINTRPRLYEASKYENDKIWSISSPRYRIENDLDDITNNANINGRKNNPHDEKPLGQQSFKISRPVTVLDTVVRLAEREKYRELLAYYTSRKQTSNESSIIGSQSTGREPKKHGGTETTHLRNSRYDQESLLGASHHSVRSTRLSKEDIVKPVRVQISPSKSLPQTIEISRTISPDVTKGLFDSKPSTQRKKSAKSIDVFDDGWIKKWKENLSTENIEKERQIAKEKLKLESLRKEKNEKFQQLSEEVKARMQGKLSPTDEKVVSFPELTPQMNCVVDKALGRGAPNEQLVETPTGRLTRADIATLGQQNWLNDEVVNAYFQLLADRSKKTGPKVHSFNTFFYPKLIKTGHSSLRRWTKKVDLFSMDMVLLPIHLGMHWCLAVIDFKSKVISYYDSLKGDSGQCLQALRDYLCAESLDKKKQTFDLTGWKCDTPKNIPEQLNGCDCGVFVCKYAEYISRRAQFDFTQYNMPYFRRRMVYEILSKKLM